MIELERWPESQHRMVAYYYAIKGPRWVAARLHKSASAVGEYARRHGIYYGVKPGYLRVGEVASLCGARYSSVLHAAKQDGVFRRFDKRLVMVPEKWGLEYMERIGRQRENQELLDEKLYFTIGDAAEVIGCGAATVKSALRGRGWLGPALGNAKRRRGNNDAGRRALAIEARAVYAAKVFREKQLRVAEGMYTYEQLCVMADAPYPTVKSRLARAGVEGVKVYVGGKRPKSHFPAWAVPIACGVVSSEQVYHEEAA